MSILLSIVSKFEHVYPFWHNGFFYLSGALLIIFIMLTLIMMRTLKRKNGEMKLLQQQHAAKIDSMRREHLDTLEKIRQEMLKREEEHGRLWHESEKDVVNVLNGVGSLLELNEQLEQIESIKILAALEEIEKILNTKTLRKE